MRSIRFEAIHPCGEVLPPEENELLPFLITAGMPLFGQMPPLTAINEFLSLGKNDSGMGGGAKWVPFSIESSEYDQLKSALSEYWSKFEKPFTQDPVPDYVSTLSNWRAWSICDDAGIYKKLAPLQEQCDKLVMEIENATEAGNMAAADHLEDELSSIHEAIHKLLNKSDL